MGHQEMQQCMSIKLMLFSPLLIYFEDRYSAREEVTTDNRIRE